MPSKHTSTHADDPFSFSYEDMLRTSMAEVKEPGRLPSGQWIMRCQGAKVTPNEGEGETIGTVLLTHIPVNPGANVETADVEDGAWRGKRVFTRFNIRDKSDLFQVKNIIAAHGISDEHDFEAALALIRGRTVEATVGLRTYKNRSGETVIENTLSQFVAA